MQQQQIQKLMLQQNSYNQPIVQANKDNLLQFPYQYYPYWTYPIYPNQGHQFNNYCIPYCKHCKQITYQTVMTQTYDNLMEVDQQSNSKNIQIMQNNFGYSRNLGLYSYSIQQNKLNYQANFENSKNVSEISGNVMNCQEQNSPSSLPQDPSLKSQKPSQSNNLQITQNNNCQTNQQLFYKMLQFYKTHPKKFSQLTQNYLKSQSLISQLVKYFNTKLDNFKKSKQQMIKLIIRKTQRQYKIEYNCKRDQRFTKFGGFKSMNSVYLQKLFSDPNFVSCYNMIIATFIEDFEKQNLQKLTDFIDKICAANNYLQYKSAMRFLDEKNKMPWPAYWIQKLKKTCEELKLTYIVGKNIIDQNQRQKDKKQKE